MKKLGLYPVDNTSYLDFVKNGHFIKFGGAAMGQSYQIYPCVFPVFGMTPIIRLIMNLRKGFFYKIYNDKIIYKINDNSLFFMAL